jgi:hypothetical protein
LRKIKKLGRILVFGWIALHFPLYMALVRALRAGRWSDTPPLGFLAIALSASTGFSRPDQFRVNAAREIAPRAARGWQSRNRPSKNRH